MGRASAWLVILALALPISALADEPHFEGELIQVTANPAFEFQPRIDGDIVVFTTMATSAGDIAYVDLATMSYHQLTDDPATQHLQDVSGSRITYTDGGDGTTEIMIHDLADGSTSAVTEAEGRRRTSAIDGGVVVYVQIPDTGPSNIWASDLDVAATVIVTDNDMQEDRPTVSGRRVAFERQVPDEGRKVIVQDLDSALEIMPVPDADAQQRPHLHGDRLVFDAFVGGRTVRDLVVYDLVSGETLHLALDGNQTFARISGDWLAFDDDALGSSDIVVMHLPTGFVHRITDPDTSDFLNDIDGNRVVFTSNAAGSFDIWMFEFDTDLDDPDVSEPPDVPDTLVRCDDQRPFEGVEPIASVTVERAPDQPTFGFEAFSAEPGPVAVVVDNDGCAAGWALLNGQKVVRPGDLDTDVTCLWGGAEVRAENLLAVKVASAPGCSLTVSVYAIPAEAEAPPPAEEPADEDDPPPDVAPSNGNGEPEEADPAPLGCQIAGGTGWIALALVALAWLVFGGGLGPAPVRVRRALRLRR